MATTPCTPDALAEAIVCLEGLDDKQNMAAQTFLLAELAGESTDPQTLADASREFGKLTTKQLLGVQAYLLCKINGG